MGTELKASDLELKQSEQSWEKDYIFPDLFEVASRALTRKTPTSVNFPHLTRKSGVPRSPNQ